MGAARDGRAGASAPNHNPRGAGCGEQRGLCKNAKGKTGRAGKAGWAVVKYAERRGRPGASGRFLVEVSEARGLGVKTDLPGAAATVNMI